MKCNFCYIDKDETMTMCNDINDNPLGKVICDECLNKPEIVCSMCPDCPCDDCQSENVKMD